MKVDKVRLLVASRIDSACSNRAQRQQQCTSSSSTFALVLIIPSSTTFADAQTGRRYLYNNLPSVKGSSHSGSPAAQDLLDLFDLWLGCSRVACILTPFLVTTRGQSCGLISYILPRYKQKPDAMTSVPCRYRASQQPTPPRDPHLKELQATR